MALSAQAVADACRYVDGWLPFRQRHDRVPGVQAAVLHAGRTVLAGAYGHADVERDEALTIAHRFRIASHSKTFTATAVMQLVERGELRLDDRVGIWVPEVDDTALGSVTVRELLAHGGGVVRDGHDGDFWQLGDAFPDRARLAAVAADAAAVFARNERFKYSNIGYGLLGLVVAAASGRSFADHVRTELIAPLSLGNTTVDLDAAAIAAAGMPVATGYTALAHGERRPIDQVGTGALAAATGFASTATDVVRWFAAHFFGDERLVSDDAKRLMQRVEWAGEAPGASSYGLGMMVDDIGGRRVIGHGGGWPGHITRTFADPVDHLAVTVLTNAIDGPAHALASTIVRLVDLAQQGVAAGEARPAADPGSFRGRFANLWGVFDVVDLGGRLYKIDPTLPLPAADAQRFDIVDADTLVLTGGTGYGSVGERYTVERDGIGVVVSVRGGSGMESRPYDEVHTRLARADRVRPGYGRAAGRPQA